MAATWTRVSTRLRLDYRQAGAGQPRRQSTAAGLARLGARPEPSHYEGGQLDIARAGLGPGGRASQTARGPRIRPRRLGSPQFDCLSRSDKVGKSVRTTVPARIHGRDGDTPKGSGTNAPSPRPPAVEYPGNG
jgi:hypothetical protein